MIEMAKDNQHTVMPKKLAQALMDAGMKHFDGGGFLDNAYLPTDPGALGFGGNLNIGQPSGGAPIGGLPGQMMGFNQYEAHEPGIHQQNFDPRIQQGESQQTNAYKQQQALAQALLSQSQGQGPNPVQAQLAQQTGNNVQNQGALMASQRGANSNPALMARQAAMQGANTQQQGVGQAATLQAQQQLAAQQQQAGVQAQMAQEGLQQQQISQGAQAAQNTTLTQGQLGAQNINANVYGQNAQQSGNIFGSLLNSAGSMMGGGGGGGGGGMMSMMALNKGGRVPQMSGGGIADFSSAGVQMPGLKDYTAFAATPIDLSGDDKDKDKDGGGGGPLQSTGIGGGGGQYAVSGAYARGGVTLPMLAGGDVPGKANVKGDSKSNDTQPALLSPGEIVIPRSIAQSPDRERKVIEFLRHLKGPKGYQGVMEARKYKGGRC